ncbi:MiaB/RimO family radical SAM methylthiotransferase [Chloroflexota bacterium]
MPLYYIWTIGCQMNKAESVRLASFFESKGFHPSESIEEADLIILNSCVVRQNAENKVINKLGVLKSLKKLNPQKTIALTGCLVDPESNLGKKFPQVDYFFKPGELPQWLESTAKWPVIPASSPVSEFVTIMQGCNNFCSYCIVPYRRGRERSRPVAEILNEVEGLVGGGAKEITLLGQNVDSYGQDLAEKPDLADLLREVNAVHGLYRIRFLTSHPKDMGASLIDAVASLNRVCEHINLPVQAGDNEILRAMRRGYTVEHYRSLVAKIRAKIPGIALSTDIIVGFPEESEQQFHNTYSLLSEIKFDTVHVAAYSTRPGTIAAREYLDNVPPDVKKERLERIEKLQEGIACEINSRILGSTVEVLVEGNKGGKWYGRSRTDKLVFFKDDQNCANQLARVRITKASSWSLQGEVER